MRYSPESLVAFVEAAAQGSFSAAARKLKKSQSTISIAIANLESDLGVTLFDRNGRQPELTEAGRLVLVQVRGILGACDRLDALAVRLAGSIELRLSVVMSDVYNFVFRRDVMEKFAAKFPDTELQCGPSEGADVITLIQEERANIGIVAAQPEYPQDVAVLRLPIEAEFGLYVSPSHPLVQMTALSSEQLNEERQLCLKTYTQVSAPPQGKAWSAPDYLSLLELAVQGFGWAELPRALVQRFGKGDVVELRLAGYPRRVDVDVVWSRRRTLGPAGQWFVRELQHLV
ncbi:LysR family transcriptional regulator [Pseudomonas sp. BGr12]|uniref:LysR family transcriptional regulator n=1 Tax=Pseudomonas sp. BGr12 TaxID=2936269 RepID=UPI002559DC7D|nr:LysR family transcriptional regulator [Pseudomonas sp. BJa5]MDL2428469.1 LysR family transcriptional regulator [Pseudomonas sp. BJa5]